MTRVVKKNYIVVCQNYSVPQTTSVKGVLITQYLFLINKPVAVTLKDSPHHRWNILQCNKQTLPELHLDIGTERCSTQMHIYIRHFHIYKLLRLVPFPSSVCLWSEIINSGLPFIVEAIHSKATSNAAKETSKATFIKIVESKLAS